MTDRPTPETDAHVEFFDLKAAVNVDFSRKLERERDEARKEAEDWRKAYEALSRSL